MTLWRIRGLDRRLEIPYLRCMENAVGKSIGEHAVLGIFKWQFALCFLAVMCGFAQHSNAQIDLIPPTQPHPPQNAPTQLRTAAQPPVF